MPATLLARCTQQKSDRLAIIHADCKKSEDHVVVGECQQMLSSIWFIEAQLGKEMVPTPLYIRPLGQATALETRQLITHLATAEKQLASLPAETAMATLSADASQIQIICNGLVSDSDRQQLGQAIQNGRVQLCINIPDRQCKWHFQLEVTIFHNIDKLWSFDIPLDTRRPPERELLLFLANAGIWSVGFYFGEPQYGVQLTAGFEQLHLPPFSLQSRILG